MIGDFLTQEMTLSRMTNQLLSPVVPASPITPQRQPARAAYVEFVLTDVTSGGSVYVNGTSGGAPLTEGVVFASGTSTRRSLSAFTLITSLTLSGVAGGSLEARAVAAGGEPVTQEVVEEMFNGAIRAQSGRLRYLQQGSEMIADYQLSRMYSALAVPRKIVSAAGRRYEIVFVSQVGSHGNILCDLHLLP